MYDMMAMFLKLHKCVDSTLSKLKKTSLILEVRNTFIKFSLIDLIFLNKIK